MRREADPSLPAGTKILIVEDDFMVARSLELLLRAAGCEVVAVVGSVEQALASTERVAFHIAVLDVHLRGDTVARFAEELAARGRPFVFLTGYADLELLPAAMRDRPRLDKPVDPDLLISTLAKLLTATPVC